jgi:hypothetical protein
VQLLPNQEPENETSGLEGLLNNPRVSDEQIIQALVAELFEQVYQYALQRQPCAWLARLAACQALAQAVNRRQSYWGEPALEDWLGELVDQFLAAQPIRGEGDSAQTKTGDAPETPPQAAVEQALAELRRKARRSGRVRIGFLAGLGLVVVLALLWLAGGTQLFTGPDPFSRVRFTYPYIVQPGDTLASIARRAGVRVDDIQAKPGAALAGPLTPGATILLPSLKPALWQALFPPRPASPPAPLTLGSTPAEIKQRILDSPRYWQTLWAERIKINYGPPGIIVPLLYVNHQQIWIRQPGQGLMLEGGVRDTLVTNATYFDGSRVYQTSRFAPDTITTVFSGDATRPGGVSPAPGLPFMPDFPNEEWEVKTIGTETVAGREALVVDRYLANGQREARMWVDAQLGVVLAERWFGINFVGIEKQLALWDEVVLRIQFGVKVPEALLDPNSHQTRFVKDAKGDPLEVPDLARPAALRFGPDPASSFTDHILPPDGFDVSQSRLTLYLQPLPADDPYLPQGQATGGEQVRKIDVFGDDYYLGTFSLDSAGWVYLDFCSRSPDGSLVLFDQLAAAHKAYWLRLSDLQQVHSLPKGQNSPGQYAFSPSSRQLAYFRCSLDQVWCGVSLVNLETGEISPLIETPGEQVIWLGYSPDGGSLAVISRSAYGPSATYASTLEIYDLNAAKIMYSGVFNTQTGRAAPDAPTQAWGAAFNPFANWSQGCATP